MGIIITIVSDLLIVALTITSTILAYKKGVKASGKVIEKLQEQIKKDAKEIDRLKESRIEQPKIIEIERPDIITIKSCREVTKEMAQYYGEKQMEMIVRREIATELTDKLVAEMRVQKNTDYARFVDIYSARIRIIKENL